MALFELNGIENFSSYKWCKPGPKMSYEDSEAFIRMKGGRMLTLEEARDYLNSLNQPPCHGEDQWAAVSGRDWVQIGDTAHQPGKSHLQALGQYPVWGDNPDSHNSTCNIVVLFYDYNCFALPDQEWRIEG